MSNPIPCNMDPQFLPVHLSFWHRETTHELVSNNFAAFARLVRRQREALGWSQRQASAKAEVNVMAFNLIENMECVPSKYALWDVMRTIGLTRADIVAEIAAMADEEAPDEVAA